jgi:hypothetical protein
MYLLKTDGWYLERLIYFMGGAVTLLSVLLVLLHSIYWLILTTLVGIRLLVFGLTGFCVSANLFYKLGAKPRLSRSGR